MKFFIDTANLDEIKAATDMGLVDGVTTNPTLMSKEAADWRDIAGEICRTVPGPVSLEVIALDAGHVCQNLYLACEAIGAGTCAVAAYHQQKLDELLRLDGRDEFVIYLAPVGKV